MQYVDTPIGRMLVPYHEAMATLGGIGRTKFYGLIDNGDLVRVNIGRRGFITAKSLAEYVDSLTDPATA